MGYELRDLERELRQVLGGLDLRPTLQKAARAGELLARIRDTLPRGEYVPFLSRVGLKQRTAWDYIAVHKNAPSQWPATSITIKRFLQFVRQSQHKSRRDEAEAVRAEYRQAHGTGPDALRLVHADCRTFRGWPKQCQGVVTDPVWWEGDQFSWLGRFAADRLVDGGLLLVMAGQPQLVENVNALVAAGLTYCWTFSLVLDPTRKNRPVGKWVSAWRPVVVLSKGKPRVHDVVTDTQTIRVKDRGDVALHEWSKPVKPLTYWLGKLFAPGGLLLDPFAGGCSTAVAAHHAGLRWVGTEVDKDHYEVARGRLAGLVPAKV